MCVAQGFSNYYQAEFEKVFRRKCRITSLPNALHTRVYFKLLLSIKSVKYGNTGCGVFKQEVQI